MDGQAKEKNIVNDAIIKDIYDVVKKIHFGTVTLKVHEAHIVQVDVTESRRFDEVWLVEKGGGI